MVLRVVRGCMQAKEARDDHKEELKHTHDKGMANLSNAAVRARVAPRHPLDELVSCMVR